MLIKMKHSSENLFCQFFGYSPEVKIIDSLLEFPTRHFTFNDIVKEINVNRKRAYEILHYLLDEGFIKEVEKIKNIQFYVLNVRKPEIKCLDAFFKKLLKWVLCFS